MHFVLIFLFVRHSLAALDKVDETQLALLTRRETEQLESMRLARHLCGAGP